MIPLFTPEEFEKSKSKDKLPCKCKQCKKKFLRTKHDVQIYLNPNQSKTGDYCSKKCQSKAQITQVSVTCLNCNRKFLKNLSQTKKYPNHFCSSSCSATYNNKHKTHGTRRSKLEVWLEEQLTQLYPDLPIDYNRKDAINSELDIYIPSLKLAFELNGIFHYEPIYGEKKLAQIQNNDTRKFQACIENNVELCIIDTSGHTYVKPKTSQKYLDIISEIIDVKLSNTQN